MTRDATPQACILCGEANHRAVFRYDGPDVYERTAGVEETGYLREWVACAACRFHYSRHARDPDILDRLYDDAYRTTGAAWRGQSAEEIFQRVLKLPAAESETVSRCAFIKTALRRLDEDGLHALREGRPLRLLDVGGATGVFAHMFQDDDWRAEIVDPGRQGRFIEAFGIAYHQQRFDAGFGGGPYQLVSMIYMLEHVHDPFATIAQAKRVLAGDGLLYIEVPDAIAFEKKPAEDDIFNSCHLWMFDPASLTRLLSSCGFEPLDLCRIRTQRGHFALTVLARAL